MIILLWIIEAVLGLVGLVGDIVAGLYWMVKHPVKSAVFLAALGLLVLLPLVNDSCLTDSFFG